jgi:hypothetical protein
MAAIARQFGTSLFDHEQDHQKGMMKQNPGA